MFRVLVPKEEAFQFIEITKKFSDIINVNLPRYVGNSKSLLGVLSCLALAGLSGMTVTFPNGYKIEEQQYVDEIIKKWGIKY